ncbi:MAG TPA: CPBP family intramembrane glutamic endopeptidase [Cyclobacteriaceae bacterium]|nr:CPBP family intramembrane glutamic endopeptidase [Cyclobacteriaceae bacterium]
MIDPQPAPVKQEPSPWNVAFVVLLVTVLGFGLVAQLIGLGVAFMFYDGTMMDFANDIQEPTGKEELKALIWIAQGITTVLGLAVIPFVAWWTMRRKSLTTFFSGMPVRPVTFLLIIGIVISFTGLNSVFIEWNSNIDLPFGWDTWARAIEEKAMELTKFLTSFSNVGQYLVGVLVVAVFAGFAEELAFRGLLQPELQKAFKNHHAAIWVTAIFFSALHLQFYGFFPRMLLGALFGYMYYWSGNLIVPVFAHFVNNLFAVSMIYFGLSDLPGMEENPTSLPWYAVALSSAVCFAMIYYFRSIQPKPAPDDIPA